MTNVLSHVKKTGLIAVAMFFASAVLADDSWVLTGSDFRRSSVGVESLDGNGIKLVTPDGAKSVRSLDEVLRLEHSSTAPATTQKFNLFLQGGDRIVGQIGELKDEILKWNNPVVGDLSLPLSKLRAFSRSSSPAGLDVDRKEDQVVLSNRDIVRGVVAGIEDGKIMMQTGGDTVSLPVDSSDSIFFASSPQKTTTTSKSWRVQLTDNSVLTASVVAIKDGKLTFQLPGPKGVADAKLSYSANLANVQSIEQLNGPVSWLSDRTASINKQVPFNSEMVFPARMNLNVFGKPLRAGTQTFEKGIGVHANSVVTFPLDGSYGEFRTRYAIDTTSEVGKAVICVRIRLDGKIAHEQKNFRAFKLSPVVTVDLSGARELTLEVVAEGVTDTQDRLDWIEPALIRTGVKIPATAPSPTSRAVDKL